MKSNKVYVIAEIGINHEGDVSKCQEMIDAACQAGADAVKLQTIDADANYVNGTESYAVFKDSELTQDETNDMFQYAKKLGVDIFTTCGDLPTAQWVDELNPVAWKISSGLLTHIPMIRALADFGRPMLISTGMAKISEIDQAIEVVKESGNNKISLFQCTSLYPAPPETLNLAVIKFLKDRYGYDVGFSDHSIGDDAAFLAVATGATMIEKHFTFDTKRLGFDHGVSLEHDGFRQLVKRIRLAELIMGTKDKVVGDLININRSKYLRTIVALKKITKGNVFDYENLGVKRALQGQLGYAPKYIEKLIGRTAARSISKGEPVMAEDVLVSDC